MRVDKVLMFVVENHSLTQMRWAHPALHRVVATTPLNRYSLTRLVGGVLGVTPLREGAGAPSLIDAFGLRLSGRG